MAREYRRVPAEPEKLRSEMSDPPAVTSGGLDPAELAGQEGVALPDRQALSTVPIHIDLPPGVDNLAVPINEAIALNQNSSGSYAIADADQIIDLDQSVQDGGDTP
jgi:hypothetical protein